MKSVRLHGGARERRRGKKVRTRGCDTGERRMAYLDAPAGDVRKGTSCSELNSPGGYYYCFSQERGPRVSPSLSRVAFLLSFLPSKHNLRRALATRASTESARTPLISPLLLGHYLYANEKPAKRRDIRGNYLRYCQVDSTGSMM